MVDELIRPLGKASSDKIIRIMLSANISIEDELKKQAGGSPPPTSGATPSKPAATPSNPAATLSKPAATLSKPATKAPRTPIRQTAGKPSATTPATSATTRGLPRVPYGEEWKQLTWAEKCRWSVLPRSQELHVYSKYGVFSTMASFVWSSRFVLEIMFSSAKQSLR